MKALLAAFLLSLALPGCIRYEYEHEFWLRVDGSGRVFVTGRPGLWSAFKGAGRAADPEGTVTPGGVRSLFERSGLRVRRTTLTRRAGQPYVFIAADFDDVNRLAGTPAFPDLRIALTKGGDRLKLEGEWSRPRALPTPGERDRAGQMAVRFHLPSKVYDHKNAVSGLERGNILSWRQEVRQGLNGQALVFGATLDARSILWSTLGLFSAAIAAALALLAAILFLVVRAGRRARPPTAS